MKREIKFRAWLIKENKIVSVDTLSNNKGYGGALEIFVDNPLFDPTKKNWNGNNIPHDTYINHSMEVHKERNNGDDFILMQFTGLKDKNGKEIYEGDIIRRVVKDIDFDKTFVVMWNIWDARFWLGLNAPLLFHDLNDVVVGNIYENPELIEKQLSIP